MCGREGVALDRVCDEHTAGRYDEVPYYVLKRMTSYINYGGRVTDYIDLRTIDIILRQLYCPEVMRDDYKFSGSGTFFSLPVDSEHPHQKYMEYIEQLPLNPAPEAFGMHDNANIICAEQDTTDCFNVIVSLQANTSDSGGQSREEVRADARKRLSFKALCNDH